MANTTYASVLGSLTADVPNNGTLVIPNYPTGYTQASFTGANAASMHELTINDNDRYTAAAGQLSVSFGASTITITNLSGATWRGATFNGNAARYRALLDIADPQTFSGVKQTFTDSSGGTASASVAAIAAGASYAQSDITAIKNGLASIVASLKAAGILA